METRLLASAIRPLSPILSDQSISDPGPGSLQILTTQRRVVPHDLQYPSSRTVGLRMLRISKLPLVSLLHLKQGRADVPRRAGSRDQRIKGKGGNETIELDILFARFVLIWKETWTDL